MSYDWPGNVRELENAVQHMVAMNSGPWVGANDLPSTVQNHLLVSKLEARAMAASASASASASYAPVSATAGPSVPVTVPTPRIDALDTPVLPLSEVERRAIMGALDYTRGDRAVAAHLLGIGRTTLYRKLKEYSIAV
jgi:DNA-binding NtrC family response regulator